jgi:hypothetical protein
MAPRSHGGQQDTSCCVGDGSHLPVVGVGVTHSTERDRGVLSANTGRLVNNQAKQAGYPSLA